MSAICYFLSFLRAISVKGTSDKRIFHRKQVTEDALKDAIDFIEGEQGIYMGGD